MANYHLGIDTISRSDERSITGAISYISGKNLRDCYIDKYFYKQRDDVLFNYVFLPNHAPTDFYNLQILCNAIDQSERYINARTAREFKGSLPNELEINELKQIVKEFVERNFVANNLCAIVAIHEGKNKDIPSKDNPHAHIIVPTRFVEAEGFGEKDREHNKREYIDIWREQWEVVQNKAYERNHLAERVNHHSLEVQGIDREPTIHLSLVDWQKEKGGERTVAGDKKRAIEARNKEREQQREKELKQEKKLKLDIDLFRHR